MLDFRPDLDLRTPELVAALVDMMPTAKGYRSVIIQSALTGTYSPQTGGALANETYPNNLFASRWLSTPGGIVIAATNRKLNVYNGSTFINVSRSPSYNLTTGTTYQHGGEGATDVFDLCAFGDVIIAANKDDYPQYRSALDLTIGTLFADLTGAPKAATCCTARNFVFLGNCETWSAITGQSNIVAWSALGDHTDWTVNPAVTQCSYAILNDTPGPITCVRPFRDGVLVFKADAMYFGRYVGAGGPNPLIWDFERISDEIGCPSFRSFTHTADNRVVWVGRKDIYQFDGTRPQAITYGIRETLAGTTVTRGAFSSNSDGSQPILVSHDKPNQSVDFVVSPTLIYTWNYQLDRWGSKRNQYSANGTVIPCRTNADNFAIVSASTVTAGVPTYTVTTSAHTDALYSLHMVGATPYYRSGSTRSTASSITTGVFSDKRGPTALQTLQRVNPIFSIPPTAVSDVTMTTYAGIAPTGLSSAVMPSLTRLSNGQSYLTMDSKYRFDCGDLGGSTNNFFQFVIASATGCEICSVVPAFKPAGEL